MKKTKLIYILVFAISFIACNQKSQKADLKVSTGDATVDQLSEVINSNPENSDLYYQRANVYYDKSEYEPAIVDLTKAISIDSLVPKYYHLLSDAQMDYYKSREALSTMEEAARRFPERIPTLLKLSEMQYILNQNENSVFTLNEILRLNGREKEAFFMLGMNFRTMNDMERAINSFQTAVEIDPEMVDAWLILGELHEKNGDKNAIKYYDNAIRVAPDQTEVLHSKAFYLQNNGDVAGALDLYSRIITNDRQYEAAYLNSGILYMEVDSIDKAYEQFNILVGIKPQNPLGHYYRGLTEMMKGNYDQSITDIKNSLNIDPENENAQSALAKVMNLKASKS